jgi:hypothetical protein
LRKKLQRRARGEAPCAVESPSENDASDADEKCERAQNDGGHEGGYLLSADRRADASFAAPLACAYLRHGRSQGERDDYDDDEEEEGEEEEQNDEQGGYGIDEDDDEQWDGSGADERFQEQELDACADVAEAVFDDFCQTHAMEADPLSRLNVFEREGYFLEGAARGEGMGVGVGAALSALYPAGPLVPNASSEAFALR